MPKSNSVILLSSRIVFILQLAMGVAIFLGLASAGPSFVPPESPTSLIPPWFAFNIGCKLHEMFKFLAFATQPPDAYIIELTTAYWDSEVAYALTKNKILDTVQKEGTPISCEKVAEKLDLDAFIVCRYMESGMHLHLLSKDDNKEFSITTHGTFLTDTGDLKDFLLMINEDSKGPWRAVATNLMKDGPKPKASSGYEIAYGMETWTFYAKNPEQEAQFDRAMKSLSPGPTGAMILDWDPPSDDATFCDVGGGVGSVAATVLQHYPKMKGIVFDRPEVAGRATAHMEEMGLADRTKVVGGNFLETVPDDLMDCDVFHMRYIVHDWDDATNVKLLKNIREIAEKSPKDSKKVVVVQDQIIETGAPSFFEKAKSLMAINMIASNPYGARERTVEEHGELFAAAGYKNSPTLVPMRSIISIVEVDL